MSLITVPRKIHRCALCKYWNGAIGSVTIQILPGGNSFTFDSNEKHSCFKEGRGMQMNAIQECPYFKARYEN